MVAGTAIFHPNPEHFVSAKLTMLVENPNDPDPDERGRGGGRSTLAASFA